MKDPNHLYSQNHYSNYPADNSPQNLVNQFSNLWSSETDSVQRHDQDTTVPSNASGSITYSVQNPNPEFNGIQPVPTWPMGQAPILPVSMETQQGRFYSMGDFGSHSSPQQFHLPRSLLFMGLGLNAPRGFVYQQANPFSQTIDAGSSLRTNNLDFLPGESSSNGQNPSAYNEEEIQDLSHKINGGIWGGWSSMQTIFNHPKLHNDDPTLLLELGWIDIVLLAKCEKGTLYLQNIVQSKDTWGTLMIFEAFTRSDVVDLLTDRFGNYVFRRLLESGKSLQIEGLVRRLITQEDALFQASINKHGVLFVQKLIKTIKKTGLLDAITTALAPRLVDLMINRTGCHVIRTCLAHLDCRQNSTLYEVAVNECLYLATHERGCITLNNCIDCITDPQRRTLLHTIVENSIFLAHDPYGNYVVQHVLRKRYPHITVKICQKLRDHFVELSMLKSASHVVEKCITSDGIVYVFNALIRSDKLLQVAKDPFGNFVIQTALKTTKDEYHELYKSLVTALQPHFPELQFHPNGKNVYNLIKGKPIHKDKVIG